MGLKKRKGKKIKLFVMLGCLVILIVLLLNLYDFLALTRPVEADVLVVDGWMFDFMLEQAAAAARQEKYRLVIALGTAKQYAGDSPRAGFAGTAEYGAWKLAQLGVDPARIRSVSAPDAGNQHTYATARELQRWLAGRPEIKAFNIYTGGAHGRKSYTLFKRVFGKGWQIGVISSEINHYNSKLWWSSPQGIASTLRYFIGYLYARLWPFDSGLD